MGIPEASWSALLEKIEDGRVIPVLGPMLAEVELDGVIAPLEIHLARRLTTQLGLGAADGLPAEATLFEVVACAHRKDRDTDVHELVYRMLRDLGPQIQPSPALASLARIADFRVYLSLGFDDLARRALAQERGLSLEDCDHPAYAPNQTKPADLPVPYPELRAPLIYGLLGKACTAPEFVISEEDLVEWVTALQDPDRRPPNLFDALRRNHLLFLGCRLPDWLLRFFIRMARETRYSMSKGNETLIGLDGVGEHARLVAFLDRFSPRTQVVDLPPAEFVTELADRWSARRAAAAVAGPFPAAIRPGGVFLSYASGDRPAAKEMVGSLMDRQVDTFYDENRIAAGSYFDQVIGRSIGLCGVFLPLLSTGILARLRRWKNDEGGAADKKPFFLQEWELALSRRRMQPEAMAILPVQIDDFDPRAEEIPAEFRALSWRRAPDGKADEGVIDEIKKAVRDSRRQRPEAA